MFGPIELIPQGTYWSKANGEAAEYYFEIPFAGQVKHISADLKVDSIDTEGNGTKVNLAIDQTLTRELADADWKPVDPGLLFATSTGYDVATTDVAFGPIVRVRLSVEEDDATQTTQKSAVVSVRVSGKPF